MLGTVMVNLFPDLATVAMQNWLILGIIGVLLGAMAVLFGLRKAGVTLPALCVFGCFMTTATQCVLMYSKHTKGSFIAVWYFGKLFGFISSIAAGFVLNEVTDWLS